MVGMGRELIQHEAVFRQIIERCDALMRPWARFSLMEELDRAEEGSQLHRTEIAQPAIFAMQVALASSGNPGAFSRLQSLAIASAKWRRPVSPEF